MKTRKTAEGRIRECGLVITLVAVVLLFVVGAMAVLAIDVATFYTARSEAQLAADSTALSAARGLANSGMTSNPTNTGLVADAERVATILALQVATHNEVGGRDLVATSNCADEVCVAFNDGDANFGTNPHVTVTVKRADLPTFFARIWGTNLVSVQATAVAEAYNPSGVNITSGGAVPVAPTCVKPWVLPNMSPINGFPIFNSSTGAIQNASGLLGWTDTTTTPPQFKADCTGGKCGSPQAWQYYPGDASSFPPPQQALPDCGFQLNAYEATVASCVTTPIACNSQVNLDSSPPNGLNRQTARAVNCLTHTEDNQGDRLAPSLVPPLPTLNQSLQFQAGADNPIPGLAGKNVLVSDSLVTVPVYDSGVNTPPNTVTVIGFVQLFLNWDGMAAQVGAGATLRTLIVNLVGCGTSASGQAIAGNGASAVAVRLIHP